MISVTNMDETMGYRLKPDELEVVVEEVTTDEEVDETDILSK